jgi:hypothetical protein
MAKTLSRLAHRLFNSQDRHKMIDSYTRTFADVAPTCPTIHRYNLYFRQGLLPEWSNPFSRVLFSIADLSYPVFPYLFPFAEHGSRFGPSPNLVLAATARLTAIPKHRWELDTGNDQKVSIVLLL